VLVMIVQMLSQQRQRTPALVFGLARGRQTHSPPVALLRQREGDLTPPTFCSLEETCLDDHGGATPDAVNESRSGLVDYVVAVNTGNGDTNGQCRDDRESVVSNADRANGIVMTTAEVVDGGHPGLADDDTHVKVPYMSNGQSALAADDRNRHIILGSSNVVMEGQ